MRYLLSLVLLILLISSTVNGQTRLQSIERESLRGLTGVGVLAVLGDGTENETAGITLNQLRADMELRIRKAGIKVLSNEEVKSTPGNPVMVVIVNTSQITELETEVGKIYTVSCLIEFKQYVALKRNPTINAIGTTWERQSFGYLGASKLRDLKNWVADYVDQFINDFLAMNPHAAP